MARGWESKSIEAQQDEAQQKPAEPRAKLTSEEAELVRTIENLRLSRQRILHQLENTLDLRHRKLLERTLAALDEKLAKLRK